MTIVCSASRPRAAFLSIAALLLALLALPLAPPASAEPVEVTDAPPLTWGFKQSWRGYAGEPLLDGGAQIQGSFPWSITWPFVSGSYDPETQTTQLGYRGSVRWQSHPEPAPPGEPEPYYLLDVTLSDPQITISRDSSKLTAVASSRDGDTHQIVHYGRMTVVDLDVIGNTPAVADGTTTWTNVIATVAEEGNQAFDGTYRVGQVVDPVGFSYSGPGGAPDFSEHWDTPGMVKLRLVQNELFIDGEQIVSIESWVDRRNMIVHSIRYEEAEGVLWKRIEAFSLRKMKAVGAPLVMPYAEAPQSLFSIVAFDSNKGRFLYRNFSDPSLRWIGFDPESEQYTTGVIADPQLNDPSFIGPDDRLAWDHTREQGYCVERVVPDGIASNDYDNHEWSLIAYREGADGIWSKRSYELPGFGPGQNRTGYAVHRFDIPTYATASDGSLIVLATTRSSTNPSNPVPATIPGAYRLVLDEEAGAVDVQPLAGSNFPNTLQTSFTAVQTAPNGHVLLINRNAAGNVVHLRIDAAGQVEIDAPVSIRANVELSPYDESRYAIDPEDGMIWFGGVTTQKLAGIRDGVFAGGEFFQERSPRGGPVLVGDDHTVYAQTSDGTRAVGGGSFTWGYGKFERVGFVPTVATQPQPQSAALSIGEQSDQATFASVATGDPAPSRRWQVKAPGSSRFVDVEGETGETLTVEATRTLGGAEYRAVYENAAGQVASDPATLTVDYAPQLLADAADVAVVEGSDAELSLEPDGSPAPAIAWQRRVGGFWQAIDPDDDNFVVAGASLTVLDANTDQSGTLLRAKLVNDLGVAYSRAAKLTVSEAVSGPVTFGSGHVDWGFANRWRCYVVGSVAQGGIDVAGGVTRLAGTAATGSLCSGGAAGSEAFRFPVRGGSYDPVTGSLEVKLGGSVRFWGHTHHRPGDTTPQLDTTFRNLRIVAQGGVGALYADSAGATLENPTPVTRTGVALTSVDLADDDPVPTADGLAWGSADTLLTATGAEAFGSYPAGEPFDPVSMPLVFGTPQPDPAPEAPPEHRPAPDDDAEPATIVAVKRMQAIGVRRYVRLATVKCPRGGDCTVRAPKRVTVVIAGRLYRAIVVAPRKIGADKRAFVRARLTKRAAKRLAGRKTTIRVRLTIARGGTRSVASLKVTVSAESRAKAAANAP